MSSVSQPGWLMWTCGRLLVAAEGPTVVAAQARSAGQSAAAAGSAAFRHSVKCPARALPQQRACCCSVLLQPPMPARSRWLNSAGGSCRPAEAAASAQACSAPVWCQLMRLLQSC